MTIRDHTLIVLCMTMVSTTAKLTGLVALPWWLVIAPVGVLAAVVGLAFVMLVRARK